MAASEMMYYHVCVKLQSFVVVVCGDFGSGILCVTCCVSWDSACSDLVMEGPCHTLTHPLALGSLCCSTEM